MREIKFRAWDKKEKEMVYDINLLSSSKSVSAWISDNGVGGYFNPKAEKYVVMQYTGLKDKNGKEVCEGDIIKIGKSRIAVEFEKGCFQIARVCFYGRRSDEYEVIGNIYENPELLEA